MPAGGTVVRAATSVRFALVWLPRMTADSAGGSGPTGERCVCGVSIPATIECVRMRRCDPTVLGRRGDLHTRTRRGPTRRGALPVLAASFACGAIPFAQLAARIVTGTDLRRYGAGTVSGTALYEVAGFGPLAIAGCLEVAKGGVGPWWAGRSRPILGALAAAAGVTGHNWYRRQRWPGDLTVARRHSRHGPGGCGGSGDRVRCGPHDVRNSQATAGSGSAAGRAGAVTGAGARPPRITVAAKTNPVKATSAPMRNAAS